MMCNFCIGTFWMLFILSFNRVDSQVGEDVPLEVITESSPCSATCGLGIKSQTLCLLNDSKAAIEEDTQGAKQPEVTQQCRVRKVQCLDSWQCGLRTLTVTEGQRLSIDCVEEVMKEMGPYSWRVSWRYARGVITSDDSLFARWEAPELDHMLLDPVKEKDAGTYRCDVQDAGFRRVKRIYWGVRVLPPGVINLDMRRTAEKYGRGGDFPNHTHTDTDNGFKVPLALFPFLSIIFPVLGVIIFRRQSVRAKCFKGLSTLCRRKEQPPTVAIPLNDLQMTV